MLEAVEGGFCLLKVLELLEVLEVPEVMLCVLLCILEAVEGGLCLLVGVEGAGGHVLCAALYAFWRLEGGLCLPGYVGRAGSAGGDVLCAALKTGGSVSRFPNFHCGSFSLQSAILRAIHC